MPGTAAANVSTAERSLNISVASGESIGKSHLRVGFRSTTARVATNAMQVELPAGEQFQIQVCLQTHVYRKRHATTCSTKDVDTRSASSATVESGFRRTASLKRPAAGSWSYAHHQVAVMRKGTSGKYTHYAGTAGAGLAKAAVPLPPVGARRGRLPRGPGLSYPNSGVGGINSAYPKSVCMGSLKSAGAPSDVSTTALGSDAPAYYEVGEPTGAYEGAPPKGVMLVIHGGGWFSHGSGEVASMRPDANRWRARGWRTLSVTYRPCERAVADVRWFYDTARALWGADMPYCALGASAGANLALILAASRPDLACAINQAGTTNGLSLGEQTAYDASIDGMSSVGPRRLYNALVAAVGEEQVRRYSPALSPIKARVLSAYSEGDPIAPYAQAIELRKRMLARDPRAYSDTTLLEPGSALYFAGHAMVSQSAVAAYHRREEALVAPLVAE